MPGRPIARVGSRANICRRTREPYSLKSTCGTIWSASLSFLSSDDECTGAADRETKDSLDRIERRCCQAGLSRRPKPVFARHCRQFGFSINLAEGLTDKFSKFHRLILPKVLKIYLLKMILMNVIGLYGRFIENHFWSILLENVIDGCIWNFFLIKLGKSLIDNFFRNFINRFWWTLEDWVFRNGFGWTLPRVLIIIFLKTYFRKLAEGLGDKFFEIWLI